MVRTEIVHGDLVLNGYERESDRMLRAADGRRLWILNPPTSRRWTSTRRLVTETPVRWSLTNDARGVVLRCDATGPAPIEVDLIDMGPDAAASLVSEVCEPMLVLGSFSPLESPSSLGRFLVGGEVLDTTDFDGHRVVSEQTALSLYRIARHRGGPFWELVASHLTSYVAARVEQAASGRRLVHDMWGAGESHARFVADAALLLLAAAEHSPEADDLPRSARGAVRLLDEFARPWRGGTWYAHDSCEVDDGRNDLVLNTHLQAIVVRLAAGLDVGESMRAAHAALALIPERARGWVIGHGLRAASALGLTSTRPRSRLVRRFDRAAVGAQLRHGRLAYPGGWIARDASGHASPDYYLTVNLNDLATVAANMPAELGIARSLARGLRFGAAGYFAHERRRGVATAVLVPNLLRISGDRDGARRAAARLRGRGVPPAIGWPGFEDHLWARLRAGTP